MSRLIALTAALLLWPLAALAAEVPPLVDAAWVKANAARPEVVILDVRNKLGKASARSYRAGHIPGAVYSDYLRAGWRKKVEGVPGQLPPVEELEALIGGLGIDNDSHVVVVAGGVSALDMGSATRVYFTFKVLGHDKVSVLDGGWKAYAADPANPVETGENKPAPKTFKAAFRPELLADRTEVAAAVENGATLLDLRPTAQYLGEKKHMAARRAGTLPGARSLPEGRLTSDGGRFVGSARVSDLLAEIGADGEEETISFCNTGHWASLGWFVKSELLGQKNTKLYDGSMVEWTADASLPVENRALAGTPKPEGCTTC